MNLYIPDSVADGFSLQIKHCETRYGRISVMAPVKDVSATALINDVDGYRFERWFTGGNPTILEIGTGLGVLPVILQRKFNIAINYIGVEPVFFNYVCSLGTCALNNVSCCIHNFALGATDGVIGMIVHPSGLGGASSCVNNHTEPHHAHQQTETVGIKRFCTTYLKGVNHIDVLVLDCEGAEHEIVPAFPAFPTIGAVCGELHENDAIRARGYSNATTLKALHKLASEVDVGAIEMMNV